MSNNSGASISDIQNMIESMVREESTSMQNIIKLADENTRVSGTLISTVTIAAGLINQMQNNIQDLSVIMQKLNDKKLEQDTAIRQIAEKLKGAPTIAQTNEAISNLKAAIKTKANMSREEIDTALQLVPVPDIQTNRGGFTYRKTKSSNPRKEVRTQIKQDRPRNLQRLTKNKIIRRKSITRRKSLKGKTRRKSRKYRK